MDKFILLIVLFLLAGAIPLHGGLELAIFRTPVFWALLAILAVWCIIGCCRFKRFKSLRGIGFLLAHGGVALLLLGAAIGLFAGKKTQFAAYIGASPANELPAPANTTYPLDFSLAVTDFKVDYYPPSYHYYAPPEKEGDDFTLVKTLKPDMDGTIRLPKHGDIIPKEKLADEDGNWKPQVFLDNGGNRKSFWTMAFCFTKPHRRQNFSKPRPNSPFRTAPPCRRNRSASTTRSTSMDGASISCRMTRRTTNTSSSRRGAIQAAAASSQASG